MWWIERKHLFSSGPLTNCHQSNSSHNLGPLFVAWPGEEQETWEENRLRHTRYFISYLCTVLSSHPMQISTWLYWQISSAHWKFQHQTVNWPGTGEQESTSPACWGEMVEWWTREQPVDFHPSACKHLSPSPLLSSTQLHNDGGQSPRTFDL